MDFTQLKDLSGWTIIAGMLIWHMQCNKKEKDYYRNKIDDRDNKIEKITNDFTEVIKNDLKEVKGEMKRISEKLDRREK